jgi:hypothetical protein
MGNFRCVGWKLTRTKKERQTGLNVKNLIQKMCAGLDVSPGSNCAKKNKNTGNKSLCSKLSAVVATANFQQRKTKKKICGFLSGIVSEKRLLSCSR